jgi:hypothetical protein
MWGAIRSQRHYVLLNPTGKQKYMERGKRGGVIAWIAYSNYSLLTVMTLVV